MGDIETLKAWVHWKLNDKDAHEDDIAFAKAVSDVISQVGTWKAKHDKLKAGRIADLNIMIANEEEINQLNAEVEQLKAELDDARQTRLAIKLVRAEQDLAKAVAALEFIAVPGALQTREDWQMKRARAVLAELKREG